MPEEREGLYAAFVGSTEPLAVIKDIDASEALKIEGVVAFLDAKDVPGENKSDVEEVFASKKVSLAQPSVHSSTYRCMLCRGHASFGSEDACLQPPHRLPGVG